MKAFVVVKMYERLLQHGGSVTSADVVSVFATGEAAQAQAAKLRSMPSGAGQGPATIFVVDKEMSE
jgi:hypothetical protein